ncbi:glycosyltransferase [Phenylobacterium sp. J367]|uniref:glycosyltransferase n=1 Tax=Phenylobacterium sp. J367 TaxID=2898435 RepID=UPI00215187EA|nr:glycosyltransferase [Phenylobacterium sp. J367]MCR5877706.1 glycosyltransferase [Phenylobacterium sp. J367]
MSSQGPVALFCAGLAGDGVARNTVHLANALVRRGIPARIVALETGALADQLRPEVRLTLLGRRCGARARALAAALPALRRTLARERPSVLVSMGNHAHLAAWTALRTLPGLPRIYRISNDAGHGGGAVAALRTAAQRLIAADATRLICVSRALAEAAPFRQAARARRVEVLPNGVDVDAVRALAAAPVRHPWLEDGRPFLAALGRVHPQKNYGPLVSALALARQADPSLRLLVLGRTGGAEDGRLAAQVRALGLGDAVRFEGEAANPYPFLARARAYALTSRWEGASNSLLEALACGTPVIASRTAGNAAEVLDGGRHGLLVDPSDHEEIAQAILRQWGDGPWRPEPGPRPSPSTG